MQIGSETHKELFCRSFIGAHRAYEPEALPWPELDGVPLERLRALPFWGEALATETETGLKIEAYARTVRDPLLRDAIALQGAEEMRHARLIQTLMQRYGIEASARPVPGLPASIEQAFVDAGYGECIDSFFAFGLFEIARQSRFFPESLLSVIEPIVEEEAAHIVFFVNWEAYQQIRRQRASKLLRAARALRYYSRAVRRRLGAFRSASREGFTASGASRVAVDLTPETFLRTCLRTSAMRLASFDNGLLRPRLMPALARMALRGLEASPWQQRRR